MSSADNDHTPQYEQACHNLRLYVRQAKIPRMLCTRFCPHLTNPDVYMGTSNLFLLSTRPEPKRKLKLILHLLPSVINKKIISFLMRFPNKPIPGGHDCAYRRPVNICVPAESFDIAYSAPAGIYDVRTMSYWMDLPLLTAERVMSLAWPRETRDYCIDVQRLSSVSRTPDADLYREYYYKKFKNINVNDVRDPMFKIVIAQLVPWAFTNRDLEEFVRVAHFPAYSADQILRHDDETAPPTYSRVHRIWAKIWDSCTRKNCPYFAISVYDCWIFGVFVKGWTTALISERVRYTTDKPTVLQWVLFWIATAMKLPGGWETPLLARFGNPDIKHLSRVALQLATEDMPSKEDLMALNEEWLDDHHSVTTDEKNLRTREVPGLENTWLTRF